MQNTIPKAFIALFFLLIIFVWSITVFQKQKSKFSLMQLSGSVLLLFVALFHSFEEFHLFTFMQWGQPHSIGHYLDFFSAILGVLFFLVGIISPLFVKRK